MSINEQLLVTVYIPTFNRLELLHRAVESVRNQTYKNLEIIVVDDCSTDGTQKYLEQLAKEDSRVRYFLKEKNSGACVSRNIAIENAKGEFITGLDDDDYFLENRVQTFLKYSNLNDSTTFFFDNNIVKVKNKLKYNLIFNKIKRKKVFARDLIFNNYVGNQIFIKTSLIKDCGGFDVNMKMFQDLECYYNILKIKKGYALNIGKSTYIQDVSHEFERISNFKNERAISSMNYFSEKHSIIGIDKKILFSHFYNYDNKLFDVSVLKIKLKEDLNLHDLKRFILCLFKKGR